MEKEFVADFSIENNQQETADFSVQENIIDAEFEITLERNHEFLYNRDKANQHPISAITGLEEALRSLEGQDKYFVWEQGVSSNIWNITHNLDKYPSVTVVDNNNRIMEGDVRYIDLNHIEVTFNASFQGKAYLN